MFALAYRMLGSATEAEDVVQDVYLRWNGATRETIQAPGAWLAKVVTNMCLNRLTSARARREQYVGPWLPEPILTDVLKPDEPAETVLLHESVSLAFLLLLERLTPAERAVFVLREAFSYGYRDISAVLDLSEANCRQLHRRAQRRLGEQRRFDVPAQRRESIVRRFLTAAGNGDLAALEQLLAADVTAWSDGGGKASAARKPVLGPVKIARFVLGLVTNGPAVEVTFTQVNGEPGLVATAGGRVIVVAAFETDGERIFALRSVLNPDKLRYVSRQLQDLSHPGRPSGS
ncbi:sigma factor [Acrocarpospora corrugata]|uniref:Sigma factor n=2 Tax=Acrocarpospora corrugata TaxID=35763 RepID=A0A5M3VYK0_9ACTN|nr:sigma factor [Acrocarpospora corrugata]